MTDQKSHDQLFAQATALLSEDGRHYDQLAARLRDELEHPMKGQTTLAACFDAFPSPAPTLPSEMIASNPFTHWQGQMKSSRDAGENALADIAVTQPLKDIAAMRERGIYIVAASPEVKALRSRINASSHEMGEAGVHS